MEEAETDATENKRASEAKRASAMLPPPPPPISPPALIPAPAAGEEGPASLAQAGAPGCSRSRPPELEPERSLGRLRGRFEDYDEELEEDEEMEEEEEEEEEMSHFSLRLESGRADSEDEEERLINLVELTPYILCSICKGEKKQMHDFYKERGLEVPKPAVPQPVPASKGRTKKALESVFRIPPELDVSLLLEFIGANEDTGHFKPLEKKFVRVSGEATIGHVEKFLRRKMGLDPACQVDIICGDHLLERYQTLREIRRAIGDTAMQDGLLVLHYGLVVSPLKIT